MCVMSGSNSELTSKVWVFFEDKSIPSQAEKKSIIALMDENRLIRRQKVSIHDSVTTFDLPVHEDYIEAVTNTGVKLQKVSKWLNAVSVIGSERQLAMLDGLSFVKKIKPVQSFRRSQPSPKPIRSKSARKAIQSLDYGNAQSQIEQINCDMVHNAGYNGEGIRILVMDTGFSLEHDVFDSLNLIAEWDFVNDDSITANQTTQEEQNNQHNHGTMVLSAMAANLPGFLIGPAFKSEYLLAKTEMVADEIQVEEDNYVAGLEWGEINGADVVSTSLGYLDWYQYEDLNGDVAVTTIAVDIAAQLGMVCVTAAGNEGNSDWYFIIAPADADSVISVGAVNSNGAIASFSSHGPTYDGRIKPEVCARGIATACASPAGKGYTAASGTSLATPLVGGAAALILDAHPDWTPMMVREAMMQTASQANMPDNNYGYGIINVWDAINYSAFQSADSDLVPLKYHLSDGYPNPFNSGVDFSLELEYPLNITAIIYHIDGTLMDKLLHQELPAGRHAFGWNPMGASSGVYVLSLSDGFSTTNKKITYLK